MGLFDSPATSPAVSGLSAAVVCVAERLSGNIANSQTIAYKRLDYAVHGPDRRQYPLSKQIARRRAGECPAPNCNNVRGDITANHARPARSWR